MWEKYRPLFVLKLVVHSIPHTNKLSGKNTDPRAKPGGIYIYIYIYIYTLRF